jgi:hypothetical protein
VTRIRPVRRRPAETAAGFQAAGIPWECGARDPRSDFTFVPTSSTDLTNVGTSQPDA